MKEKKNKSTIRMYVISIILGIFFIPTIFFTIDAKKKTITPDYTIKDDTIIINKAGEYVATCSGFMNIDRRHIYGHFRDSAILIETRKNIYSQITNITSNLFIMIESEGFNIVGDTIIPLDTGVFDTHIILNFSGTKDVMYAIRMFNPTTNKKVGDSISVSGLGFNHIIPITLNVLLKSLTNDKYILQITSNKNAHIILMDGAIYIHAISSLPVIARFSDSTIVTNKP